MGSQQNVNDEQYTKLDQAGQLQLLNSTGWINTTNGEAVIHYSIQRQCVSLMRVYY